MTLDSQSKALGKDLEELNHQWLKTHQKLSMDFFNYSTSIALALKFIYQYSLWSKLDYPTCHIRLLISWFHKLSYVYVLMYLVLAIFEGIKAMLWFYGICCRRRQTVQYWHVFETRPNYQHLIFKPPYFYLSYSPQTDAIEVDD